MTTETEIAALEAATAVAAKAVTEGDRTTAYHGLAETDAAIARRRAANRIASSGRAFAMVSLAHGDGK